MSVTMDPSLNAQLRNSFRAISERFLNAIVEGPESLAEFHKTWAALQQNFATGQKLSFLDEETVSLAHDIARSIAVMGQSFLDVENLASSLSSHLLSESAAVLDAELPLSKPIFATTKPLTSPCSPSPQPYRIPKPSLQLPRHPITTPITSALAAILPSRNPSSAASVTESTRSASDPNPLPEFIEHAYKYFVANLFNPYPSRDDKQAIVDKTDNARVTLTSVSNWFTNARRRCGWAEILKGRCNGNREVMVDLAKRVFVKPDPRNPVEPEVMAEFMEMKDVVESMYERKTRTSAWIEDLDGLDELVNPMTDEQKQAAKKRETDEERETRRREKEMQREQREFERQKRKMQAEALRKADRVTKKMQREQEKEKKREQRMASFAVPSPPHPYGDEESVPEAKPVAGGKRKLELEDRDSYAFPELRHVSPAPSLSSSFTSDGSSIGRVPSLTWSDSGDERPYKRSRSSPFTPPASSPRLSPALEIPTSFDYSFTFDPPASLTTSPTAFDSFFDLSVNPCEILMAPPPSPTRGQKRRYDVEDTESTPRAKRAKPVVASAGPELTSTPLTPLFTPPPSLAGTPTQAGFGRRRSSLIPIDLDTVLGLDQAHPQPVQIAPPDASVPLEVDVFDWSSCSNPGLDQFSPATALDHEADFSQLFHLFSESLPDAHESQSQPHLDAHLDVPAFDLPASNFLSQGHNTPSAFFTSELPGGQSLDLSGLMNGLMSDEALNDMGLDFSASVPPTPPDLSRSSSVSPEESPAPVTPSPETSPTPADLADKALNKERKRRALEEKRAALEREHARLAEMERELEDD